MPEKIGFVGVGRMGANMARRLKDCGYEIGAVFDSNAQAAESVAAELGSKAATDLREVTRASDVVFTVISDDKAMKAVFNGGLLSRCRGRLFVNCATLTPAVHAWAHAKAEKAGADCLEASMASSIPQARQGTLYLMIGGKPEVFERARPLLEKLSASMRLVGGPGKAAEAKAIVNMVMNINTAGLAEGLALGEAVGLDLTLLREILSQTGAHSRVLETDGPDMQNRDHACFFSAAHAAKDSGIALRLGKDLGLDLPLAAATRKQFQRMIDFGLGELDKSGVAELTFPSRRPAQGTPPQ